MVSEEFMDEIIDSEMEQIEEMELLECLEQANAKIKQLEDKIAFSIKALKFAKKSLRVGTTAVRITDEALRKLEDK